MGKSTAHVGWFWSQTPNFEPIELLVPPLSPPDTAVVACFLLKKHTCKVWAVLQGGPVSGQSPRHGFLGPTIRVTVLVGLTSVRSFLVLWILIKIFSGLIQGHEHAGR